MLRELLRVGQERDEWGQRGKGRELEDRHGERGGDEEQQLTSLTRLDDPERQAHQADLGLKWPAGHGWRDL